MTSVKKHGKQTASIPASVLNSAAIWATVFVFTVLAQIVVALPAHALSCKGMLATIGGYLYQGIELVIGAVLVALFGFIQAKIGEKRYTRIANTMVEIGEATSQLGKAMLTGDKADAKQIIAEIRDVADVGANTPSRYANASEHVAKEVVALDAVEK